MSHTLTVALLAVVGTTAAAAAAAAADLKRSDTNTLEHTLSLTCSHSLLSLSHFTLTRCTRGLELQHQ